MTTDSITYREIKHGQSEEDITELRQMMLALYQEDPEGEAISSEKISRTVQELTQHPEKGRILFFMINDQVVGYVSIVFYWSNEFGGNILSVDELYVKPAWRNQGIATRCLKGLMTTKQFGPLHGIQLEVTPSNRRALRYYQKLGLKVSENTHLFKKLE